ncbi:RcnB family protein [Rhizobium sp. S152]|uniref:RcnB family protein n=1 Tax=Rhizobium sp. S152 TaxID=3055038 RepID=UPI0025A97FEE|nr:RcnB family protein [Rhizobium sp. S152]MDM9628373.1 RcnB family protein [Rhizobium sp. S152]
MKKIFAVLLSASFLAAPLVAATEASAQDHRRPVVVHRDVHVTKYKWSRGHRMSPAERRHMQEVRDYRRYRLAPPPRGYRWVRVNNDYLMISVASNVISSIVTGR